VRRELNRRKLHHSPPPKKKKKQKHKTKNKPNKNPKKQAQTKKKKRPKKKRKKKQSWAGGKATESHNAEIGIINQRKFGAQDGKKFRELDAWEREAKTQGQVGGRMAFEIHFRKDGKTA